MQVPGPFKANVWQLKKRAYAPPNNHYISISVHSASCNLQKTTGG
jgi:hypothetical protein